MAAAQDNSQTTGEDIQAVHQQEAQTGDSKQVNDENTQATQQGPQDDILEQPSQQQDDQGETAESVMSDDTDELIDRVLKGKCRRRRSSSTSSSEQYHHRKIKKHLQALGAKRYRRKSARAWQLHHKRSRIKSNSCPHDVSQWEHMRALYYMRVYMSVH